MTQTVEANSQNLAGHPPGVVESLEIPVLPSPYSEAPQFQGASLSEHANESNITGFEAEQKVGKALSMLPYVESVRQAESQSDEDVDLTDLVVKMREAVIVPEFKVQVKASKWGVANFYDEVGKRMRAESEAKGIYMEPLTGDREYYRKRRWIMGRRLIVINGGIRAGEEVDDKYIVEKFVREAVEIAKFERQQKKEHEIFSAYLADLSGNE